MRPFARRAALVAILLTGALAAPATAFDTGPHADITVDAMRAEGFGPSAADVVRVNNWFVDLYSQAAEVPNSGHAGILKTILGSAIFNRENWSRTVMDAVNLSHFDFGSDRRQPALTTSAGVEAEWDRLRRTVFAVARNARAANRPLELLTAIGASLHALQDFYSHSNWIEPRGVPGFDGPGWEGQNEGATPTWFDVPKGVRDANRLYSGGGPGNPRNHGHWKADGNRDLATSKAKDWTGRPLHSEARQTAYFATRQWIRAIRTWVGDDAFWARAQRFAERASELRHDVSGSVLISSYSGHWDGQGGPCKPLCDETSGWSGSLVHLRDAVIDYFDRSRTTFRRTFERIAPLIAADASAGIPIERVPVASSRELQAQTQFVRAQVLSMRGLGLGDPGPDDADLYARAVIAGQRFESPVIHAHDRFSFPRPYFPFTWFKAVPRGAQFATPVTEMTIEVRTSSARSSGTDDDVSLRIGPGLSFALDKRVYDDFERGDRDTYSVPIDAATRNGLTIGDIRFVEIHKSRDGIAGGWKLGGIRLRVNGRTVYANDRIERWLEDDRRTWRAPDFRPSRPVGPQLGFWVDLREDDLVYGDDDQGDVNIFDARNAVARGYAPGGPLEEEVTGGDRLGGRLGRGGDRARLRYRLETIVPVLPAPPPPPPPPPPGPPPPPPPGKPDLTIAFSMTLPNTFVVTNSGTAPAGPFTVTAVGFPPAIQISGLAAGESATRTYANGCAAGKHEVRADSLFQVDESDETNNVISTDVFC